MEIKENNRFSSISSPLMSSSSMAILLVVLCFVFNDPNAAFAVGPGASFIPKDNFLIDCGANKELGALPDGRLFQTDEQSEQYLEANDHLVAAAAPEMKAPSPVDLTARIFLQEATYIFQMAEPGWHWLRLHFLPVKSNDFDLLEAKFSVVTEKYVLLHSFNINNDSTFVLKEFLLNITDPKLSITFFPLKNSAAFINAIEVVSAPMDLIADSNMELSPVGTIEGLTKYAFQTLYRLNMGGPIITPRNDTIGRTWETDEIYRTPKAAGRSVIVETKSIKYQDGLEEIGMLIAPPSVYASAVQMGEAHTSVPNFNVTWKLEADPSFGYLIRFHFCDIVSKALNNLYFNVYVNGKPAITNLDLSHKLGSLATAYYKDVVVNASLMVGGLTVQIGPANVETGDMNAILNGLEVLKISNSVNSLDGEFGVDGKSANGSSRGTVAAVGFAMMFGAFVGLGAMVMKWHKRPQDWQKRNSFSSWLLPVHAGDSSFMSKSSYGSHKTNLGLGLGRLFSLAELQEATKNFDPNSIIGVGGFGNVYIGVIDEGTKVAVKRGNPQSEQGITEFQTEIHMLSKLRHRHLVSLIGYCDENSEMILVYEFMSNGPFRDHLYGKDVTPLSWKQRLEICIGAARGLHYLHTGTAQGIIHRDVKTTNILLDESFTAKVADFGLSKDAAMGQGHVSTAVKGSFGYLDPEYFRRQQLTEKSDVYSFGVVLLEALCARPAINPSLPREQVNLADWAMQCKRKGCLEKIMDPLLVGATNPESMTKLAEAAEKCLAEHGVDRPSMGDVLWNLEYALQLQESFSEGKGEDESTVASVAAVAPATAVDASTNAPNSVERPVVQAERSRQPVEVEDVDDDSGSTMFAHFSNLNGR
ncbi:probable receptor-like protein kinase At4g39110 [Cucurbita pepo subsp. pepo]|uniref:probable receptor-like protein kinase At4g39110 n=2 Tax=Cucurbita pepo subsp. pepo TaxID=3664 RepID=UPI000C9D9517|nr:probable receptor-like protein kinase At4g39110 [Cucurbita pepo subsp. pepo]